MKSKFSLEANQHIEDCRALGLSVAEMAFSIIVGAGKYSDEEVRDVFAALPSDVLGEVKLAILEYKKTGEYHVISSTGITKDLSELMERISQLI